MTDEAVKMKPAAISVPDESAFRVILTDLLLSAASGANGQGHYNDDGEFVIKASGIRYSDATIYGLGYDSNDTVVNVVVSFNYDFPKDGNGYAWLTVLTLDITDGVIEVTQARTAERQIVSVHYAADESKKFRYTRLV